jgi:hypothetical protein
MKNQVCILLLLLTPFSVFAQFAKIVDKDGYVNVREGTNLNSKVIAKIKSNEIVFISNKANENDSWSYVYYELEKGSIFSKYISGYVYKARLKQINTFSLISSDENSEKGSYFNCCGVDVQIKSGKFDFIKNKKYFQKYSGYYTYKGKYAFGALGVFPPKTNYLSITGNIGRVDFKVPEKEIENLFMVNNEFSECYYDNGTKTLYISLSNSDGSDSYNALIVIEKGVYKKIIINGDD